MTARLTGDARAIAPHASTSVAVKLSLATRADTSTAAGTDCPGCDVLDEI